MHPDGCDDRGSTFWLKVASARSGSSTPNRWSFIMVLHYCVFLLEPSYNSPGDIFCFRPNSGFECVCRAPQVSPPSDGKPYAMLPAR